MYSCILRRSALSVNASVESGLFLSFSNYYFTNFSWNLLVNLFFLTWFLQEIIFMEFIIKARYLKMIFSQTCWSIKSCINLSPTEWGFFRPWAQNHSIGIFDSYTLRFFSDTCYTCTIAGFPKRHFWTHFQKGGNPHSHTARILIFLYVYKWFLLFLV